MWPLWSGTAPEVRLNPCLGLGRGHGAHIFDLGHVLHLLAPLWSTGVVVAVVGLDVWTLPDLARRYTVV